MTSTQRPTCLWRPLQFCDEIDAANHRHQRLAEIGGRAVIRPPSIDNISKAALVWANMSIDAECLAGESV